MADKRSRSDLQQEVVQALIDAKAIDFEAIGAVFSKFGTRAALSGDVLVNIVNKNVSWNCGWPGPEIFRVQEFGEQVG